MSIKAVISQPMLMPWIGMFEQIRLCDCFVFYDDVQLPLGGGRGRGFITRVQIKTPHGIDWLSLPIDRSGKGKQLIVDAMFSHQDWRREHQEKIVQAYRAAPYFEAVYERLIKPIYAFNTECVSEFCRHSMTMLGKALGLAPRIYLSSELGIGADLNSSERVLALCQHLQADEYISGLGAMNYIDYDLFEAAGVRIHYMEYQPIPYPQLHGDFTPYVSVIDLLFNLGFEHASAQLKSGCVYWKEWPRSIEGRPVK